MYQLTETTSVIRLADNTYIPLETTDINYQEYQAWLAQGNEPLPYVPQPVVAQPTHGAAWAALIVSPLYQRALQLAFSSLPVNTAMTLFGMAYQAHRDLEHPVWASALSVSAGHLAMAINASPFPLTEEEMAWVETWSDTHHLGLTFDWGQSNG